jgi:hypothetical protein
MNVILARIPARGGRIGIALEFDDLFQGSSGLDRERERNRPVFGPAPGAQVVDAGWNLPARFLVAIKMGRVTQNAIEGIWRGVEFALLPLE